MKGTFPSSLGLHVGDAWACGATNYGSGTERFQGFCHHQSCGPQALGCGGDPSHVPTGVAPTTACGAGSCGPIVAARLWG